MKILKWIFFKKSQIFVNFNQILAILGFIYFYLSNNLTINPKTFENQFFGNLIFPKFFWNFGIFFEKFEKIRFFDRFNILDNVNTNFDPKM